MTRINTISPSDLTDEWLIAEFRELPRIVNELRKYPNRFKLSDIPKQYTLGQGHVKFFRNKLLYLQKRHANIVSELDNRNVNFDKTITVSLDDLSPAIKMFGCNDWTPCEEDHSVLFSRLEERFSLRKRSYHLTKDGIKHKIDNEESFNSYKQEYFNKYL